MAGGPAIRIAERVDGGPGAVGSESRHEATGNERHAAQIEVEPFAWPVALPLFVDAFRNLLLETD